MEITKGKWEVYGKLCVLAQNVNATETICQLFDDNDIAINNAILIADAGNTYQSTNKLPSELAEANKELLEALILTKNYLSMILVDMSPFPITESYLEENAKEGGDYSKILNAIKKHSNA